MRGKREYTLDELRKIDTDQLRSRLDRIDNELAWRLAAELFLYAHERNGKVDNSSSSARISKEVLETAANVRVARKDVSPANFHNYYLKELRRNLEHLRSVQLSDYITGDPSQIVSRLYDRRPLIKLLTPKPRLSGMSDIVRFWLSNHQIIITGQTGLPVVLMRIREFLITFTWLFVTSFALEWMFPGSMKNMLDKILFSLIGGVLNSFVGVYTRRDRSKIAMALYISFTDEFIDNERQYDDPAVEDARW